MPRLSSIRCGALASDDSTTVNGTPEALTLVASVGFLCFFNDLHLSVG